MTKTHTFAGLPACAEVSNVSADIAIIGVPHGTLNNPDQPGHSAGAPAAIRRAAERYANMLDHHDFDFGGFLLDDGKIGVVDCGDLPGDPLDSAGNQRRTTETIRSLIKNVSIKDRIYYTAKILGIMVEEGTEGMSEEQKKTGY